MFKVKDGLLVGSTLVVDSSGNLRTTAATANALTSHQTIQLTGVISGSASSDLSLPVSIATTLSNTTVTPGSYFQVTVGPDGRVTSGQNPTTWEGFGITDVQPLDPGLTSLSGLTGAGIVQATSTNNFIIQYIGTANATDIPDRASADIRYLQLTGGTMTGPITLVADPTSNLQAATKQYVDNNAQGLVAHAAVRAATIGANITLSGTQTIDTVSLNVGDRVLVKDQTDQTTNGVYIVSSGAWTRSPDFNTWAEFPNAYVFVQQGSANISTGWVCNSPKIGTLGTTAITWIQFSSSTTYTATNGIVLSGTNFSLTGQAFSLYSVATTGMVALTGNGAATTVTLQTSGNGIVLGNPGGVAGNPSIALSTGMSNLAGLSWAAGSQIPVISAANAWSLKTIGSDPGDILDRASGDFLYTNATNLASGTIPATVFPALTGDVTTPAGSLVTTLATVNASPGVFGSTSKVPVITVNAKGLVTSISNATLGTTSTFNIGTSGATVPLLNGLNTWTGVQTVAGNLVVPTMPVGDNTQNAASTAFVYTATQGVTTITITALASPYTITAAQYSNPVIILTGTLSANLTLIFPNTGKWSVFNQTTGAFTVTAQTASGTGKVVQQGQSRSIIGDTTNVSDSGSDLNNLTSGLTFATDNTNDIGAVGANRPRNLYLAGSVLAAGDVQASNSFYWNTRSIMKSPADGQITMSNQAQTGFTRLNMGGNTSSFPALKVSGTTIGVRLADDSGDASLTAANGTFSGTVTIGGQAAITLANTGTAGHVLPYLDGNNTWSGQQSLNGNPLNITYGNSTSNFQVLNLIPTNFGAGNPQFFVQKSITASLWNLGIWDGSGNTGTINVNASSFTKQGTSVMLVNTPVVASQMPALTGDVTTSAGSVATTLASVNSNTGTFGSTTTIPVITVNGKGLITSVSTAALGTAAVANTGTSGHVLPFLDQNNVWSGLNTYQQLGTFLVSNSTSGVDFIELKPTDWGVGKPMLSFNKDAIATQWDIDLWDGSSNTGTINFGVTSLTKQSVPIMTTATAVASAQMPALTGDITMTAGTTNTTLATVNSNTGVFGSATQIPTFTVNGKGLITAASNVTVTPAWASVTGVPAGLTSLAGLTGAGVVTATGTNNFAMQYIGVANSTDIPNRAAADTRYVQLGGSTMTGALILNADPITALGAATKQYVDNSLQGLSAKPSVVALASSNITLSGLQTVDGVALAVNNRVLVMGQSNSTQNGVYIASSGAWVRSNDMSAWAQIVGAFVFVEQGTQFISSGWVCNSPPSGTLGTTAITFVQFSAAGSYASSNGVTIAGQNIQLSGLPLALNNLSGTGLLAVTGNGTVASRAMVAPAAGLTITNPDGVAGAPTFALAGELAAVQGLSTTGYTKRTGTATWVAQSIPDSDLPTTMSGKTFTGQVISTVATGTAPFSVASTTLVSNLNVGYLNGQPASYFTNASNINAGTISSTQMPAFTGDVTTSAGSSTTTLATVNSNTGTYGGVSAVPVITVNAKGLVTGVTTAAIQSTTNQYQSFSGNGVQTSFVLSFTPNDATAVNVLINGLSQVPNIDYTLSGNVVTFASPPQNNEIIMARSIQLGGTVVLSPWKLTTTNYTASFGDRLMCNTANGAFSVTLPLNPAVGAEVWIKDVNGTFSTNSVTILPNGSTIAQTNVLDVNYMNVMLVFSGTQWVY